MGSGNASSNPGPCSRFTLPKRRTTARLSVAITRMFETAQTNPSAYTKRNKKRNVNASDLAHGLSISRRGGDCVFMATVPVLTSQAAWRPAHRPKLETARHQF